jgi:hypothetical protein
MASSLRMVSASWAGNFRAAWVKSQSSSPTLRIPERILLFCIASKTEWERAGITGATVTAMVIKGLIERDAVGELTLTKQGRVVLAALLMEDDE